MNSPGESPVQSFATVNLPIHLGCPVWSCPHWAGQVYPPKTSRPNWLSWYSRTFNTVEGSSTFYALPGIETSRRWADEAAEGFRFSFKFPRVVSHELELVHSDDETSAFLDFMTPMWNAGRLGPTFLQLGPNFGPDRFDVLQRYLRRLPKDWSWAVELRHFGWFDEGDHEARVDDLLRSLEHRQSAVRQPSTLSIAAGRSDRSGVADAKASNPDSADGDGREPDAADRGTQPRRNGGCVL